MNEDQSAILARLQRFSEAYERKDVAGVMATFSQTTDATVVVGSICDEPIVGLDAIRERLEVEFTTTDTLNTRTKWMSLNVVGTAGWVTSVSEVINRAAAESMTNRLTAVLVKEPQGWFIAHLHVSFPLPDRKIKSFQTRSAPLLENTRAQIQYSPCSERK
ncbi:MAG: YybH family protein [Limisphaerales bacterium]